MTTQTQGHRGTGGVEYVRVTDEWIRSGVDWIYGEHVSHAHPF